MMWVATSQQLSLRYCAARRDVPLFHLGLSRLHGRKPCGLKSYHLIMSADQGFADVWGQLWVRLNCLGVASKPKHMLTPGLRNRGKISWDTLDIIHRRGSRAAVGCNSSGAPGDTIKLRTEPGWLGESAEPPS